MGWMKRQSLQMEALSLFGREFTAEHLLRYDLSLTAAAHHAEGAESRTDQRDRARFRNGIER